MRAQDPDDTSVKVEPDTVHTEVSPDATVGVKPDDAEKVRTQCHGLWVEEPAPAMALSGGINRDLYLMALSSMRLPTHGHVAVLTSNAPDVDHWMWTRFVTAPRPGTAVVRLPKGELTTAEYRAQLVEA